MSIELNVIEVKEAPKIMRWKSDKKLSELILSNYKKITKEEAVQWILMNTNDVNQRLLGIYMREGQLSTLVGIARLMFIDFESKVSELGFYIGETSFRGKGIGTLALNLLLEKAFNILRLNKIFLKVRSDNQRAIEVYKKIGFTVEGILKEHCRINEVFIDIIYMSIFKEDFRYEK